MKDIPPEKDLDTGLLKVFTASQPIWLPTKVGRVESMLMYGVILFSWSFLFEEALISYQPPRYTIYANSPILYIQQNYTQFCIAEWLGCIIWSGSEAVSNSFLHTNCILTYIPSPSLFILFILALSKPSTLSPPYPRHSSHVPRHSGKVFKPEFF